MSARHDGRGPGFRGFSPPLRAAFRPGRRAPAVDLEPFGRFGGVPASSSRGEGARGSLPVLAGLPFASDPQVLRALHENGGG